MAIRLGTAYRRFIVHLPPLHEALVSAQGSRKELGKSITLPRPRRYNRSPVSVKRQAGTRNAADDARLEGYSSSPPAVSSQRTDAAGIVVKLFAIHASM